MFKCIDFHRPEWTHRKLDLYYVKLSDSKVIKVWAYDAIDAVDSVRGAVVEYGRA